MNITDDNQYPGGKGVSGLAGWIIRQLPSHTLFIEPFAGKAAVTRQKSPALQTILCELAPEVCAWLRRECPYALVGNQDGLSLVATLSVKSVSHWPRTLRLSPFGDSVSHLSFNETIPAASEVLIYCDPPYLHSTRSKTAIYTHEWPDSQHEHFLRLITKVPCPVAISGYPSQLYDEALTGWTATTTQAQTRGGLRTEVLWRNPLCMAAVAAGTAKMAMEYSDLGETWRDRDRVNRLVKRWTKNFTRRPARERAAILRELLQAERSLVDESDPSSC